MKLLVTTNARLYKTNRGQYYTPIVYGYSFFQRYLNVFEEIRIVAHVSNATDEEVRNMLQVDGPGIEFYDIIWPHGKIGYIKQFFKIRRQVKRCYNGCDVALLRIPDQLAFQVFRALYNKIPCGVEVTSNSWEFFAPGATNGLLRPLLRFLWDYEQKRVCRLANGTSYVTQSSIQKRYPPSKWAIDSFDENTRYYSTSYSNADPGIYRGCLPREYGSEALMHLRLLHISGQLKGRAKGHKELIEACCQLKKNGYDVECILVGKGQLDKDIVRLVEMNDLKVTYAGFITAEQIKELFMTSDMFVFPSYREGLPRVVVEAMASGIVCIASDIAGNRELLDSEVLVPVMKWKELADKISFFAQRPAEMTKQSIRNIAESQKYSKDNLTARRNKFYSFLRGLADNQ